MLIELPVSCGLQDVGEDLDEAAMIETDTASRRDLVQVCIVLSRELEFQMNLMGTKGFAMYACGLDVFWKDGTVPLKIFDRERAVAWFDKMLAEFDADHDDSDDLSEEEM